MVKSGYLDTCCNYLQLSFLKEALKLIGFHILEQLTITDFPWDVSVSADLINVEC